MTMQQERRLHLGEPLRAGGRIAPDRWSATLAQPTMPSKRSTGGTGPNRRSRWRGRRPEGKARAKPKGRPQCGCGEGTGRLRRRERSEWKRALRASGGGVA